MIRDQDWEDDPWSGVQLAAQRAAQLAALNAALLAAQLAALLAVQGPALGRAPDQGAQGGTAHVLLS